MKRIGITKRRGGTKDQAKIGKDQAKIGEDQAKKRGRSSEGEESRVAKRKKQKSDRKKGG